MALVDIKGLEAFYGDMQALFGIDLSLAEGECLALVGANGAGKSTLLRCLTGLIASKTGGISFAGRRDRAAPLRRSSRARASPWCRRDACCSPR